MTTKNEEIEDAWWEAEADFHVSCYVENADEAKATAKLEELKADWEAALEAADAAWEAAWEVVDAARAVADAAWAEYQEELKKQEENSDDH